MNFRLYRALGFPLVLCTWGLAAVAQEPLTLRQAINEALGQSPETAIARAGNEEAKSAATLVRTKLLPQINFTEDISR